MQVYLIFFFLCYEESPVLKENKIICKYKLQCSFSETQKP